MILKDGEFHARDGVIFKRDAGGGVVISKAGAEFGDREIILDLTGPAWASIVAHVSARGETGDTYREALEFHEATGTTDAGQAEEEQERILAMTPQEVRAELEAAGIDLTEKKAEMHRRFAEIRERRRTNDNK